MYIKCAGETFLLKIKLNLKTKLFFPQFNMYVYIYKWRKKI